MIQGWSKLRRFWLVKARPTYVKNRLAFRRGECLRCGRCCAIAFRCPHFDEDGCRIHGAHYEQCKAFPIDGRDVLLIRRMGGECGFSFTGGQDSTIALSPHGYGILAWTAVVSGLLTAGTAVFLGWYALFFLLPAGFVAFFFRDPTRLPEDDSPTAVLAPADGRVVAVGEAEMPCGGGEATMVDIFLSVFDIHINRAPLAGRVVETKYARGKFLNALRERAGEENENNTIVIETEAGPTIEVKQISGAIARRIVCSVAPGDEVRAAERLGMIRFGSRTQLFVPREAGFQPSVRAGDKVRAGKTVVGHLQ